MNREERRRAARENVQNAARRDGELIPIPCPGCSTGQALLEVEAGDPVQLHVKHDAGCPALNGDEATRMAVHPHVLAALGVRGRTLVVIAP